MSRMSKLQVPIKGEWRPLGSDIARIIRESQKVGMRLFIRINNLQMEFQDKGSRKGYTNFECITPWPKSKQDQPIVDVRVICTDAEKHVLKAGDKMPINLVKALQNGQLKVKPKNPRDHLVGQL